MEKYIPRDITDRIKRMLHYFPSVVLVGARQVGKSTLLKTLFPNYSYVLFDPYEDIENARKDPDLFLNNHSTPLILDEVQYAPELISSIKQRIDENRTPGQYILTGSQQWGIMKQTAESLTGRTVIIQLESFALNEIAANRTKNAWLNQWLESPEDFVKNPIRFLQLPISTYEQLWRGFLPETQVLPLDLIQAFHATYQKTYIEKDVRLLANIPDLHQFTRFVRLAAALTAQEINYQEMGRDLGISNETARRWLTLLKEIFEWHEIPAFSMNALKRVSTKPKGYFADTGQVCFSQAISTPNAIGSHPLWGSLFETAVINEIRKQLLSNGDPSILYHFRTHGGAECDLIIEKNGVYYPIEIKSKSHPSKSDTSGLSAFRKTYPHLKIEKGLVICLSKSFYPLSENDYALPWDISL
ncbi:MAG: AAA family ATPase [Chlamydiales bacterium]|nr:AAA family ATPase [Chlamydiales bacterium]